jgi:hypothetical protein
MLSGSIMNPALSQLRPRSPEDLGGIAMRDLAQRSAIQHLRCPRTQHG